MDTNYYKIHFHEYTQALLFMVIYKGSLVFFTDFLPMFIYVLVQCGVVAAEIEADYMWGLLHPCLLAGEGGYHLTTLSSAVHVLKNLRETMETTIDPETDSVIIDELYV